jgi:hypothetical protein
MSPLEWMHAATDVSASGRTVERTATAAECEALSKALGITSCEHLKVAYTLRPKGGGRYQGLGQCHVAVTQACVISFVPVRATLNLPIDVIFAPEGEEPPEGEEEREILSLPEVEPIPNGQMEIGRVVFEVIAAGLDPHPRAEGAAFAWEDEKAKASTVHPFAALAKLKPPGST